jgi:transcriptional regulator with XRE-family HTH domain
MDEDIARIALTRHLKQVGYSQSMAWQIAHGHRLPTLAKAAEIEKKFGIPASSWVAGVPLGHMWTQLKLRSE